MLLRNLFHLRQFVVITGEPARWRIDPPAYLTKRFVRLDTAVLGDIAAGDHKIDVRLLGQHPINDFFQTVPRTHAQQRLVRLGEQVAIGYLHQQN